MPFFYRLIVGVHATRTERNLSLILMVAVLTVTCVETALGKPNSCSLLPKQHTDMCQMLNYSSTRLPNAFGQSSYEDVAAALDELQSSAAMNCSKNIEASLCKALLPPCNSEYLQAATQDETSSLLPPCREVCLSSKRECEREVRRDYGCSTVFKWPHDLSCDLLDPCDGHSEATSLAPRLAEDGYEEFPSNEQCSITNPSLCSGELIPYPSSGWESVAISFGDLPNCSEPCVSIYFSESERRFANIWVMVCSLVCLLVSLAVSFIYAINYYTIKHPEVPIYYISLCYIMISSITLMCNVVKGYSSIVCDDRYKNSHNQSALIHDGLLHVACASSFALIYYFTLAAQTWWVVMTFEWTMCSVTRTYLSRKWMVGCHAVGWGFPVIFVTGAFVTQAISADPVTHICWVSTDVAALHLGLDVAPLLAALSLSSSLLLVGYITNLVCTKPSQRCASDAAGEIPHALLARSNIYSLAVLVLLGTELCCQWYVYAFKNIWETSFLKGMVHSIDSSCYDSTELTFPHLSVLLVKFTVSMLVGVIAVGWVLRRELCCRRRCKLERRSVDLHTTSSSSFYPSLYTTTSTEASLIG